MDEKALAIRDELGLAELGNILFKSGYFSDVKDVSQALVKVLAGRELGFGPVASMKGIYIVKGQPSMSANIMAAAIKRSGKYNYRIVALDDTKCELAFFEQGQEVGRSLFTLQDARRAATQNMDKFPRNMLFARAMSNGARWYCPDIFGGPIYTPEELGVKVNEEGEVIEGEAREARKETAPKVAEPAKVAAPANGNGKQPAADVQDDVLFRHLELKTPKGTEFSQLTDEQLAAVVAKANGEMKEAAVYLQQPAGQWLWGEYRRLAEKLKGKTHAAFEELPNTATNIQVWRWLKAYQKTLSELEQGIPEEFR